MFLSTLMARSTLLPFLLLLLFTSPYTATSAQAQQVPAHPQPIPGNSPLPPLPQALQKNAVPISPSASTSAAQDSTLRSHYQRGAHLGPVDPDGGADSGTTRRGDWEDLPSRWKDYLPRAVGGTNNAERRSQSSSSGGLKGVEGSSPAALSGSAGTSSVLPQAAEGTVKVASRGAPQRSRTPRQTQTYDEPDEEEYDDDEEDDDDDDDEIWRAYQEKKEEEALLRRHLKSRARQEALRAGKSARRAAQAVLPNNGKKGSSSSSSSSSSASSEDSHHSLMDGLKALWSTFAACFGFLWYSFRLCTRYVSLFTRFLWSALRFSLRHAGRAFLLVWATGKYAVRQVLRPLRVVGAPVVYLFLGVKWTFWDWPSYYVFRMMREVYPLYVFLGAALALGTAIGLSSSVVLYLGSFLVSSRSPLESHLSSWKGSELSELDRRMEVGVQKGAAAIDTALGAGGAIGGQQAKKSRKESRGRASKRSGTSRAGAEESLIEKAMRERAQSGTAGGSGPAPPPPGQGVRQRTSAEDVQEHEEELPDFLKGLGSSWKPLPRAREAASTPGAGPSAHVHSGNGNGAEADNSGEARGSTSASTDTTGDEEGEEGREPEDYFSVPPATQRCSSAPSSARNGSVGGGLSPYTGPGLSSYTHQQQQHARAGPSSAYSSALGPGHSYNYSYKQGVSPLSHPASASISGSSSSSSSTATRRRRSLPGHSGLPSPPVHYGAAAAAAHSPLGLYGQPISLAAGAGVGVGGNLPVGATGRRTRGVHAR